MLRFIWHVSLWLRRIVYLILAFALVIAGLIGWTEYSCSGPTVASGYAAILPPEQRRDESRTYTTYPEWYIVHAYDDYARVIADGPPHHFAYLRAIGGFWGSLCPMAGKAAAHGGFTSESKRTIYAIGASFTAEMVLKMVYEETIGRLASLAAPEGGRAQLDDLSARQAADYARFLQQTPWYRWDFGADARALSEAKSVGIRNRERVIALGIEYRVKALYARAIAGAVAAGGQDELTIRSIVTGLPPEALAAIPGVTVIAERPEGTEIESPRYRAFTVILGGIARQGGEVVEIAGNDDILLTVTDDSPGIEGALYSFRRQGYGDYRHLVELKVGELAGVLRGYEAAGTRLEHIHDY